MPNPFAQYLDFANHSASATPKDIEKLCSDVKQYGFHAAFVNAAYISLAKKLGAVVGTVVAFPLGGDTVNAKRAAVNEIVALGADELDIVPNIGILLAGDAQGFRQELTDIVESGRMVGKSVIIKFILDPGYLTAEQLAEAARIVQMSGADYVKIGSGMGPRNPTIEDVAIVRQAVGPSMRIKVAGGVTTYNAAKSFIDVGVTRIGTSHAIEIIEGLPK